jgi:hypothetical protein
MNQLTKFLVEGILGEEKKEVVALYAGGFKPPTAGHFLVVEEALKQYPEIDKLVVLVGGGTRDGIEQTESILVWEIYQNYLPMKVEVQPSKKPPVGAVYSYAKDNPEETIYWILGAREDNEEDLSDIAKRTAAIDKKEDKYNNVEVKIIRTSNKGMSGTNARKALRDGDQETFYRFLPPEVNQVEKDEIFNILRPAVTEGKDLKEVGEATQEPYKWTVKRSYWEAHLMEITYNFTTDKGIKYQALFYENADYRFDFMFYPEDGNALDIINKGELFRVMSTIVDIMKDFIKKEKWSVIEYSSVKQHE